MGEAVEFLADELPPTLGRTFQKLLTLVRDTPAMMVGSPSAPAAANLIWRDVTQHSASSGIAS